MFLLQATQRFVSQGSGIGPAGCWCRGSEAGDEAAPRAKAALRRAKDIADQALTDSVLARARSTALRPEPVRTKGRASATKADATVAPEAATAAESLGESQEGEAATPAATGADAPHACGFSHDEATKRVAAEAAKRRWLKPRVSMRWGYQPRVDMI